MLYCTSSQNSKLEITIERRVNAKKKGGDDMDIDSIQEQKRQQHLLMSQEDLSIHTIDINYPPGLQSLML